MKRVIILLTIILFSGGGVNSNGLSFGGTRSLQAWTTGDSISFADTKFQVISVHVQNTNSSTGNALNSTFLAGWKLHSSFIHGDFLIFVLVKEGVTAK